MTNSPETGAVADFYDSHPINERQILDKMKADAVDLSALSEDILQNYDQDHFGGLEANAALAAASSMGEHTHVLDVCCGLGGPSRYYAHNYGCRVTGVDLTQSRIDGAKRLTVLTGLDSKVNFDCANALDLPYGEARFDIVISQEAFCHVPNKDQLISECARVLKPDGRIAFTDILATEKTTPAIRDRLHREMTFYELSTTDEYRARLEREGCVVDRIDDLGAAWRDILVDRLAMYRSLKDQTIERFGEAHFSKWDNTYDFFVAQYATGELSGGRFLAHRRES